MSSISTLGAGGREVGGWDMYQNGPIAERTVSISYRIVGHGGVMCQNGPIAEWWRGGGGSFQI